MPIKCTICGQMDTQDKLFLPCTFKDHEWIEVPVDHLRDVTDEVKYLRNALMYIARQNAFDPGMAEWMKLTAQQTLANTGIVVPEELARTAREWAAENNAVNEDGLEF